MVPHLSLTWQTFSLYSCNFKNKAAAWHKSRTQIHTRTHLYGAAPLFTRELYFRCAHCLCENKANLNSYWPSSGRILCWQSNTGLLTLWCSYFCCGTIRGVHIVYTEREVGKHAREHVCVCFQVPVLSYQLNPGLSYHMARIPKRKCTSLVSFKEMQ